MHLQNLIEMAAKNIGSYGAMAEKLDKPQSRISEWKKGKGKPDASEIMRLAELAGLEPIGTLLEVEAGKASCYARKKVRTRQSRRAARGRRAGRDGAGRARNAKKSCRPDPPDPTSPVQQMRGLRVRIFTRYEP